MERTNKMYYVFFDVDGTLTNIKSTLCFLRYFYRRNHGLIGYIYYYCFLIFAKLYECFGAKREILNKIYYKKYKGYDEDQIVQLAKQWFLEYKNEKLYIEPVIKELKHHVKFGAEVVFVSGSFWPCLAPIADDLLVKNIICTNLEVIEGVYTGNILDQQTIGVGKAEAIRLFLKNKQNSSFDLHFAYGDHISDLSMLQAVGNPRVVAGDRRLEKIALKKEWIIIRK
jgi:HAD superfamily hydrolase (TIGR01490 family)